MERIYITVGKEQKEKLKQEHINASSLIRDLLRVYFGNSYVAVGRGEILREQSIEIVKEDE